MAKVTGLVVKESEISQTVDLDALANAPISKDPALRNQIAQAMVDYLVDRVQGENLGLDRKGFKGYSKSYISSQNFEAFGKSEDNVNMTLSGDMMGSVDVVEQKKGKVKIAITDESALARAYGHMSGFKGHPTIPQGKYKREFFGLSDREIKDEILSIFSQEIDDLRGTE